MRGFEILCSKPHRLPDALRTRLVTLRRLDPQQDDLLCRRIECVEILLGAPIPAYVNTCYSIAGENYGFSVAAVYKLAEDKSKIHKVSGGLTPSDASPEQLARETPFLFPE